MPSMVVRVEDMITGVAKKGGITWRIIGVNQGYEGFDIVGALKDESIGVCS